MGNSCFKEGNNSDSPSPAPLAKPAETRQVEPPPPMPESEKLNELFEQFVVSVGTWFLNSSNPYFLKERVGPPR